MSRPDDHRRKWDVSEYAELARIRQRDDQQSRPKELPSKRGLLQHRDYKVDLDSKLGKTQVVTKTTPMAQQGGYYCNVCDCVVKDSINFLDHINGKKHQRNLGMSMKVQRSTVEDVRKRFQMNKRKLNEKQKEYDFDERMKEIREEEEKEKQAKREKRRRKKAMRNESDEDDIDPDIASMMGFSGFGSSSK